MPRYLSGLPKSRVRPDSVRQKIRAQWLIKRLQDHVKGKIKLTAEQIRAADILLRKIIPDLTQTSVTGELTHKAIVEVPPLLTKDEWLEKYRRIENRPMLELEAQPLPQLTPPAKPT